MSTHEQKQAVADALRRSTDTPRPVRDPYGGLRSGASTPDHRTPKQRALAALWLQYRDR